MPFSVDEFRDRVLKVQIEMRNRGLEGLLLHSPHNIYYLSGYHTSGYFAYQALLVPSSGLPLLLVRELERSNADETSWLERDQQAVFRDNEDPIVVCVDHLRELGWLKPGARIGIEKTSSNLPIAQYEQLKNLASDLVFEDCSIVETVRLVKSPQEIAYIRRAAKITDAGVRAALEKIAVGVRENEVAAAIYEAEITAGCEYTGLPHYLASGDRVRLGHGTPTEKVLQAGEFARMEITACVQRYSAAMMRTVVLGRPSDEVSRAADILLRSQDDAIRLMRPGVVSIEVDEAARKPVLDAGLRKTYHNRIGYSIGIAFPPVSGEWATRDFKPGKKWVLEAGMVFHMILVANGVSFSETVLVTETGGERLGEVERALFQR